MAINRTTARDAVFGTAELLTEILMLAGIDGGCDSLDYFQNARPALRLLHWRLVCRAFRDVVTDNKLAWKMEKMVRTMPFGEMDLFTIWPMQAGPGVLLGTLPNNHAA